VYNGTATPAV